MKQIMFNEDLMNASTRTIYEQVQSLREDNWLLEKERDEFLMLLHDIVESANDLEELEEVILRIKELTDIHGYPTPF